MHTWSWLLLAILAAENQATLTFADGRTEVGKLVSASLETIVFQTASDQRLEVESRTVRMVHWGDVPSSKPWQPRVVLRDGSQVVIDDFRLQGSSAIAHRTAGRQLELKPSAIANVLLQDLSTNEALAEQWRQLTATSLAQDAVVYRVEQEGTVRLDMLEGVVRGVGEQTIDFETDGNRIQPKRERVVGILFFAGRDAVPAGSPGVRVLEQDGSQWNVVRLAQDEQGLVWTTVGGVTARADWRAIVALDYSVGNWLFLSDLTPESVTWRPFIESRLNPALLGPLYQPRFDQAFDGGPIRLGGRTWRKGLALHSYNEVTYRLPTGYSRFQAMAGFDDRWLALGAAPHAVLRLVLDDRVVFEQALDAGTEPVPIDVPLEGARRLKIVVDFGERADVADYVNLADARLSK